MRKDEVRRTWDPRQPETGWATGELPTADVQFFEAPFCRSEKQ